MKRPYYPESEHGRALRDELLIRADRTRVRRRRHAPAVERVCGRIEAILWHHHNELVHAGGANFEGFEVFGGRWHAVHQTDLCGKWTRVFTDLTHPYQLGATS